MSKVIICANKKGGVAKTTTTVNVIKFKFLKLNSLFIEYVMNCLNESTSKVRNIKKYLLAALFNAPTTISGYYQAEVNYDMVTFGGK